jgi:hypothetical protein
VFRFAEPLATCGLLEAYPLRLLVWRLEKNHDQLKEAARETMLFWVDKDQVKLHV